ncbi:MAG TPA: HoxN/HupN/NixA family nickel/cobalt transporter [Acidimicrobiales bacterium]|nr:HoxN/HupN/NixA family nickel/cobalt transporter [Acidimicrobiales bacterium]
MVVLSPPGPPTAPVGRAARFRSLLAPAQWRQVSWMFLSIVVLHVVGFGVFLLFVVPGHYKGLGIGVCVLAYTLGLRHAFDADHISAIDNTTRKLMNEGRQPVSVGYYFALGHSTIVVAIGVGIVVAERTVYNAVSHQGSALQQFGGVFGTVVSATFLFLIAVLNLIILAGIVRVFKMMRSGNYDEAELERQLENRGLLTRVFGRWMRSITKEWQMYPVGVVFGLGFDTATEVALLATTALLASQSLPWYSIMCLPVLFTSGMLLMDTLDGCFMNVAYGWAFFNPVRKVFYNLTITGLSVAVCLFVGTIEVLGLLPKELHLTGPVWDYLSGFDLNAAGFVIVGLFVATWVVALGVWHFGHVEERWSAKLQGHEAFEAEAFDELEYGPGTPSRPGV